MIIFCIQAPNDILEIYAMTVILSQRWYWRQDIIQVADVHGILYLTVYDEDKNHKSEFLGRIAVPLLKMEVIILSDKTFAGIGKPSQNIYLITKKMWQFFSCFGCENGRFLWVFHMFIWGTVHLGEPVEKQLGNKLACRRIMNYSIFSWLRWTKNRIVSIKIALRARRSGGTHWRTRSYDVGPREPCRRWGKNLHFTISGA